VSAVDVTVEAGAPADLTQSAQQRRCVRVWFGEHVIARYVAESALAERYEHAMRRRFAGLRVTNDPVRPPHSVSV
jgi:hypothetical protein